MANAPKKRPPTLRSHRRSPRGPRPVPTNRDLRTQLAAASARLREVDSPNLAEAIDSLRAPRGWVALRDTDTDGAAGPNMNFWLTKEARDQIVAAAAASGVSVTDTVNEGFLKVIAGEYTPRKPIRSRYGAGGEKVTLNITPVLSLRKQVEDVTGMSARNVAADYLMHKFKVGPYAANSEAPLALGAIRNPQVPSAVRDLIRARAKEAGSKTTDDVNEGFQKYLAGDFTPKPYAWDDTSDMVNLRMNPNDDLYKQVRAAGSIRPLAVAIAYLLDKYGIDPADIAE